jgi:hypothetical protein
MVKMSADQLFFTAANCCVKATGLFAIGLFDKKTLTDAEDFEVAWRAMKKNIDI